MPAKRHQDHELQSRERQLDKKQQFFMAASHQLKSPVAIVQWCLQSILEETKGVDPKLVTNVRRALGQADAMSALITDMLHVFRLQDASRRNEFIGVDVNELLSQVLLQYEPIAHNRKVHLTRGPQEQLPLVLADPSYLKQAFVNLVDNAIKYSLEGGSVTVSAEEAKHGWVQITVTDCGIGIPEAEQEQLFTEFFRGVEAREVAHEGTGLGLVLIRAIITEFGGEVEVKSKVHKGTTFTVRLPGQAS
jgi:signal transduction histidine kinase